METVELLSQIEFERLALLVATKGRDMKPEDPERLREQIALRKQREEEAQAKRFAERQARLQQLNEEAKANTPPAPVVADQPQTEGWQPFISDPRAAVLIKKDPHGNVIGFACRKKLDGRTLPLVQFENLSAGPIGNFLLCAAELRKMLS
ncbi:MAG: hypothetical protein JNN04_09955 [Cyclobacteriaceae bacterium]|nr:hypothetical protein [Cyclobacteriaceae bacterium]